MNYLNKDLVSEVAQYLLVDDLLNLLHTERRHRAILANCITILSSAKLRTLPAYLMIKLFPKLKRTRNILLNFKEAPEKNILTRLWRYLSPPSKDYTIVDFIINNITAETDLAFTRGTPPGFDEALEKQTCGVFRKVLQIDNLMGIIIDHNRKKFTLQITSAKSLLYYNIFGGSNRTYNTVLLERNYLFWTSQFETPSSNAITMINWYMEDLAPAAFQPAINILKALNDPTKITSFVLELDDIRTLIKVSPGLETNSYGMVVATGSNELDMSHIYDFLNVELLGAPSAEELEYL